MTKHDKLYQKTEQHGRDLLAIFPNAAEQNPIKLCKKLFRLERQAEQIDAIEDEHHVVMFTDEIAKEVEAENAFLAKIEEATK